jgi:hypothetical protein
MSAERYLQRVAACRGIDPSRFEPWFVGERRAGRVHREHVPVLLAGPSFLRVAGRLTLDAPPEHRTHALGNVVARLAATGRVRPLTGEAYPVLADASPPFTIDRAAVPWFGVRAFGVHGSGFVRTAAGLEVWVATRARGKSTFAGHLDNLVAGGIAAGLDAVATLHKECREEADVPAELAARAVAVGRLDYAHADGWSLKDDTLFCFDLELPPGFEPRPVDGEVERFERWPAAVVAASLRGDAPWKPNCALVALHFLLRHGCLDDELDRAARDCVWQALHAPACR